MTRIDATASVAPTAQLTGDVRVGAHSRVLAGAVLDAGDGRIELGAHVIVMENAVLRGSDRFPLVIGNHCLIGPHASISGATIAPDRMPWFS